MKETAASATSIVATGVLSAELLEKACEGEASPTDVPRLDLVRDLTKDLKDQLDGITRFAGPDLTPDLMAEAALRCADLSNLASCNLDGLSADGVPEAAASVHLAAGAAQALRLLVEAEAENLAGPQTAVLRDVRGAGWRVDLAVRQVNEFLKAATEA